jgi:ParB-like chromosome segregation protein Spo0J
MRIDQIETREPFSKLFPVDDRIVEAIRSHMEARGYDKSQPIVIWDEEGVVVDGHTRLEAAKLAGIHDVPVHHRPFEDEDEALKYAIHNQRNRRNLTDAELMQLIEVVDKRKERGGVREADSGKYQPKASSEAHGKSAEETAKITGISRTKVEKARTIRDHADEKTKEDVKSGKKSINKAYRETQQRRKEESTPATTADNAIRQPDPLRQAWIELNGWREKYRECNEFSEIFDVIDRFATKFTEEMAIDEENE